MSNINSKNKGGRPKGSLSKPRLSDFLDKAQVDALVAKAVSMATNGNETMLKFVLEQHFGKAIQPLSGPDGKDLFPSKDIIEKSKNTLQTYLNGRNSKDSK